MNRSLHHAASTSIVVVGLHACGHYGIDYGQDTLRDGSTPVTDESGAESSVATHASESKPSSQTSDDAKSDKPTKPERDAGTTHGEAGVGSSTDESGSDSSGRDGSSHSVTSTATTSTDSRVDSEVPHDSGASDAGITDDGGAPTLDASIDVPDAGEGSTEPGTLDGGGPLCEPDCICLFDQCDLACLQSECLATCEPGVECDVSVGPAEVVELQCNAGAICTAADMVAPSVEVVCRGEGECRTECRADQHCDVACEGSGRCEAKCHDQATCAVSCAEGRECYVTYDDVENVELTCEGRSAKACDGFLTCNESCP